MYILLCLYILHPVSAQQPLQAALPFGKLLGLDPLSLSPNSQGPQHQLNLPFADVGLPLEGVLGPILQLNNGKEKPNFLPGRPTPRPRPTQPPLSVVNAPFSQFELPLAHVSQERQELPDALRQKILDLRSREAMELNAATAPFSARSPLGDLFPAQAQQLPLSPNPPPVISQTALKGNLDSLLNFEGPKKGSPDFAIPNKLSLPLSVFDMPLSLLDLPLSKMVLPLSHVGSLPQGLNAANVANAGPSGFAIFGKSGQEQNGPPPKSASQVDQPEPQPDPAANRDDTVTVNTIDCSHIDLVCQAAAALRPPLAINMNSFAMPYSFLNTPLGFFNLPLAYLNLPYGSFNMPLGHINTPLSFLNLPFFEMMQTFGAPLPAVRSETQAEAKLAIERESPLEFVQLFPTDGPQAKKGPTAEERYLQEVLSAVNGYSSNGLPAVSPDAFKSPADGLSTADQLIAQFSKPDSSVDPATQVVDGLDKVFRNTVPAIPQMGGLFGTPFSLFTTPFSLFNLPLGFMDMPLAFLNLPLSHFNLPLSHMTLPFSGFAIPTHDIKLPQPYQSVQNSSTALSDIPPSLLEILDPQDPLNSYLNMPLAEMNMPLAVMDMPFTVFDLPFSFLNLPLSHLSNPFTHLHLPFEISSLPFAELALPFEGIL